MAFNSAEFAELGAPEVEMCGICGIVGATGAVRPVANMNGVLRRRGPDDEGYIFINSVTRECQAAGGIDSPSQLNLPSHQEIASGGFDIALGNRRLAILDLSSAGHMPMSYAEGSYWITYNGEVYNYLELRRELQKLGHRFVSDTDTEVVLAAYAEWGTACLSRFNGMFAFALWDANRRLLFCGRDRFGVKPFYYFWNGTTFVLASEIKAVLQHPAVHRIPNERMVFHYLVLGQSDHTEQTFFDGVLSLPPGHFLVMDARIRQVSIQQWWRLEINPETGVPGQRHEQSVYAQFAELLRDAVRIRLRSDVPVGSCLSGGLDSSSIVCLANELLLDEHVVPQDVVGERQKTFTACYQEDQINEYPFSHQVVQQTGAEEHLVFPSAQRLWSEVESFVWQLDEPVNSSSQYAQWNVMRLAQQHGVTVLLDGQGGDEILGGYYTYYPPYLNQVRRTRGLGTALGAAWDLCRVGGTPVVDMLLLDFSHRMPSRLRKIINVVRSPQPAPGTGGSGLQGWQLSPDFLERYKSETWQPPAYEDADGLAAIMYRDLTSANLPKLLRYEDRNSMAFSRETRLPFLDYRLVELLFSLPVSYRIDRGWSKWILRRSMSGILPKEVCWRRTKLGFPTPESAWLLQGRERVRAFLGEGHAPQLDTYVNPRFFQMLDDLPDESFAATPGLWRMLNLAIWFDVFFKAPKPP